MLASADAFIGQFSGNVDRVWMRHAVLAIFIGKPMLTLLSLYYLLYIGRFHAHGESPRVCATICFPGHSLVLSLGA